MNSKELKPLDILLYSGKGFTSWLIQAGTGSKYNHVALVVNPEIGLGIESNTGRQAGVKAFNLNKMTSQKIDIFRLKDLSTLDQKKVMAFLVTKLGSKYDWWGVAYLGALKLVGLVTFGWFKGYNKFQKEKDYFCSELCYAAFEAGGVDIVPKLTSADITSPGDIAKSSLLTHIQS